LGVLALAFRLQPSTSPVQQGFGFVVAFGLTHPVLRLSGK
jgi:hypothetical protein